MVQRRDGTHAGLSKMPCWTGLCGDMHFQRHRRFSACYSPTSAIGHRDVQCWERRGNWGLRQHNSCSTSWTTPMWYWNFLSTHEKSYLLIMICSFFIGTKATFHLQIMHTTGYYVRLRHNISQHYWFFTRSPVYWKLNHEKLNTKSKTWILKIESCMWIGVDYWKLSHAWILQIE